MIPICTNELDRGPTERVICPCLRITEEQVRSALDRDEVHTLRELRRKTGAGDGCTACHKDLLRLLEEHETYAGSCPPICSVR